MYKVELTYFQASGKYYTDGEYESSCEYLFDIWDEVAKMRDERRLPGLRLDHSPFIVLVNVPDHPHDHPHLIGVPNG